MVTSVMQQLWTSINIRKKDKWEIGVALFGMLSPSNVMNTLNARKQVIENDTRSPEAAGSRKTHGFKMLSSIGGRSTLMRKNSKCLLKLTVTLRYAVVASLFPFVSRPTRPQLL